MKKKFKIALVSLGVLSAILVSVLLILHSDIPVLDPKGIIAQQEKDLIITVSLLMIIVLVPVFGFTLVFAYKYREGREENYEPDWEHNNIAECFWWGVPIFIILILSILTWKTTHELDPFKPIESDVPTVNVQVVALRWKWLFIYPDEQIATINFLQIPENAPINFTLTGDAPMNSFWIPRLGGQIYAMAGMRSKLHLLATETGDFRGCAAHINGRGFAGMVFTARVSTEQEYLSWIQEVKSSGSFLDFSKYLELVEPSQYDPVRYFTVEENLFDEIINQYTKPELK